MFYLGEFVFIGLSDVEKLAGDEIMIETQSPTTCRPHGVRLDSSRVHSVCIIAVGWKYGSGDTDLHKRVITRMSNYVLAYPEKLTRSAPFRPGHNNRKIPPKRTNDIHPSSRIQRPPLSYHTSSPPSHSSLLSYNGLFKNNIRFNNKMGVAFDKCETRPAHIEAILSGLDRYNPETTTVFQDYVAQQCEERTFDCYANLALLKL